MKKVLAEKKQVALLLLILLLSLSLFGCRESSALIQHLYTSDAEKVADINQTEIDLDDEGQEDQNKPSDEYRDNNDNLRDRKQDKAANGEGNNGTTSNVNYDESSWSELDADDKPSEGKGNKNEDENPGKNNGDNEGGGKQDEEGSANSGTSEEESGNGNTVAPENVEGSRQVVDAKGKTIKVEGTVSSVAATENAALIVEMLATGTILTASNADFLNNSLVKKVFSAIKISEAKPLWNSDGTSPMSSSNFDELLKSGVQACFEISGQTQYSDSQIKQLNDAGIKYVVLPSMGTKTDICQAVEIVGKLLGGSSEKEAKDYVSYYEKTINDMGKNSGLYSCYVSSWDGSASYQVVSDKAVLKKGTGLAYTTFGHTSNPMTDYMSAAGIVNIYGGTGKSNSLRYINPLKEGNTSSLKTSSAKVADTQSSNLLKSSFEDVDNYYLGDEAFPFIVVGSKNIKNKISKDALWKYYGYNTSKGGKTNGYGFLNSNGALIYSGIHGNFDIHVNPTGVGSWTDGSVESIMEPVWLAAISSDYSKSNSKISMSDLKTKLKDFYDRFYGYTLTDSQVNSILAGN